MAKIQQKGFSTHTGLQHYKRRRDKVQAQIFAQFNKLALEQGLHVKHEKNMLLITGRKGKRIRIAGSSLYFELKVADKWTTPSTGIVLYKYESTSDIARALASLEVSNG